MGSVERPRRVEDGPWYNPEASLFLLKAVLVPTTGSFGSPACHPEPATLHSARLLSPRHRAGLQALCGHTRVPSLHTLGFRGPAGAAVRQRTLPRALRGSGVGVHGALCHSGRRCLPSSLMKGYAAHVAHAAVLNREKLEGAPPAHRGGTDARNPQENARSKSRGQRAQLPSRGSEGREGAPPH